uniref:Uncharacterized protein n=1 Tax=Arundo donax TaxID=35708 RepID=A0A0A9B1F9_ARUDO
MPAMNSGRRSTLTSA